MIIENQEKLLHVHLLTRCSFFFFLLFDWLRRKELSSSRFTKKKTCLATHDTHAWNLTVHLSLSFFFLMNCVSWVDRSNWHIDKIQNNNWHVLGDRGHQLEDTDTASQHTWKLKEKIKSMGNILLQISSWCSRHHPNIVTVWHDPSTIGYNWWWVWNSSHIYQPLDIDEDLIRMKNETFKWGELLQPMPNFTTLSESICLYS